MKLTTDDVKKVAELAKLEFTAQELERFTDQLGRIVELVEQLGEVDTTGVEPMAHPLDVHTALRDDQLRTGLTHQAALANSPKHDGEFFLVPPVLTR
ncbi:MAG: Asp-tRNA(Asn)/Glu-tRNA(Gln) amidotransferase subunit GatC [Pirellulaceae bacterium]